MGSWVLSFLRHPSLGWLRIVDMQTPSIALAAASTAVAGTIHLAVVGEHAAEALWLAVGFALVGLAQLALVYLLLKGTRKAALLICFLQTAVIFGWALSRTVGLPLVAGGWTRELPGLADIAATVLETVSVLAAVRVLPVADRGFVKHSVVAGAIGLFLLSGTSAAARSISGQPALKPAQAHLERHEPTDHEEPDAASSKRSATTFHDHR